MIDVEVPGAADSQPPGPMPRKRRKVRTSSIILQILAMLGIGLLVYPDGADWISSIGHNSEISGYVRQVEGTPSEQRQRILDAAYAYNDNLEPGPLTDPYLTQEEDAEAGSAVYQAYEEMLRVSGTDAIGTVNFPRLDIALPIYHGTSERAISHGVGHMYGTSLPVGGPSTRAVLTSHSGLPQAKLFTEILKAEPGDLFWISVLGEDHHYRVEWTETVLPGETESLEIIEGEDWVTLFTCSPIGINSHRYMVHAVRVADPIDELGGQAIGGDGVGLGFPWWAVIFIGASTLSGFILLAPSKRKKKPRTTGDPLPES